MAKAPNTCAVINFDKVLKFKKSVTPHKNSDSREKSQVTGWHSGLSRKNFSLSDNFRFLFLIKERDDIEKTVQKGVDLLESESDKPWNRSGFFFGCVP